MVLFYLRGGYIKYPTFKDLPLSYRIREEGFNLAIVYLITIISIVLFYFICLKLNKFVLAIKQKLFGLL
jgi:hypothetical protein